MHHAVLGELKAEGDSGDYTAEISFESRPIKFHICPDDQPIETSLSLAAEVLTRLGALDKAAKQVAVRDLRETYNEGWNEYDEAQDDGTYKTVKKPSLSEEEFQKKILLNGVNVTGKRGITFFYDNENMFWGHAVVVTSLQGTNFDRAKADLFG